MKLFSSIKSIPVIALIAMVTIFAKPAICRETKSFSVGLKAGSMMGGIFNSGIELQGAISNSMELGGFVTNGKTDLKSQVSVSPGLNLTTFDAKGTMLFLQLRKYFSDTFYLTGGVGQRQVGFVIDMSDNFGNSVHTDATATSLAALIAIGNIWCWESGFYIGADWLGYTVPFTNKYSSSASSAGITSGSLDSLLQSSQDTAKKLGNSALAQFLVLNVGWSF